MQVHAGARRCMQVHAGTRRCTQVHVGAHRCIQVHAGAGACRVHAGVRRCMQVHIGACTCMQAHAGACRRLQERCCSAEGGVEMESAVRAARSRRGNMSSPPGRKPTMGSVTD